MFDIDAEIEAQRVTSPSLKIAGLPTEEWSLGLRLAASAYIADGRLKPDSMLRVDVVLMLLRIGDKEALERVQELTGKSILKCPSAVPPWPPKPVERSAVVPKVTTIADNPCLPGTDMFYRYNLVKKGMTREQLISRGCQARDIRLWKSNGHIKFGEAS